MAWKLIRLSEAVAAPWRNGGGVTRELATWPEGRDWTWRISVAQVAADGPFSHFSGVQRFFCVLGGNGVRLTIDGSTHDVVAGGAPVAFDGAATVDCRLLAGPTQDLNLMVRGQAASGAMTRLDGPRSWRTAQEGFVLVYVCDAPASLRAQGDREPLHVPAHTLAWQRLPAGTAVDVATSGAISMQVALRA